MIYIKTNKTKTPIRPNNTFAVCSKCGREIPVHLDELFAADEIDPLNVSFVCPECTKKQFGKKRPTLEDIVSLTSALCKLGYSRQVLIQFDNYDIQNIDELHPDAYENFANALIAAVSRGAAV